MVQEWQGLATQASERVHRKDPLGLGAEISNTGGYP